MKKLSLIVLLLFIFIAGRISFGQDISLAITYLNGEKSKDSHSMEESYAISNSSVVYSVRYFGKRGNDRKDMSKICAFTEQDLKNIHKTIETKGLNVTDSLFQESSKTKSYERYCNIAMDMDIDGMHYNIKINGDTKELQDSKLYDNADFFITMLRKMIEDCK